MPPVFPLSCWQKKPALLPPCCCLSQLYSCPFSSPSWSKGGFTWIFTLGIAEYNFLPASLNNLETALCLNIHRTPWAGIGTILTAAQTYSDSLLCFDQWTIINIRHRKNGEEYFYQKGRSWFNQCAVPVDWSQEFMQWSKPADQAQELLVLSYRNGQNMLYIDTDLGPDQVRVRGSEMTLKAFTFSLQNITYTE